ncbi:MAG: hypothetical protein BWX88_02675 [Planctomycetes bacterium ADurb.Bin126]|nr:MAG: hypothetical protein BWX88_02675 [Planctomycetes bacterium ADurb.Bin126]HOD79974.1 hypothetical protein [Phycisphaerae bacterium]HQL74031.1 hypothetical protein [Phycisphaerae bacterium]
MNPENKLTLKEGVVAIVALLLIVAICLILVDRAIEHFCGEPKADAVPRVIWQPASQPAQEVDAHAAHRVGGVTVIQIRDAHGVWRLVDPKEIQTLPRDRGER